MKILVKDSSEISDALISNALGYLNFVHRVYGQAIAEKTYEQFDFVFQKYFNKVKEGNDTSESRC